MCRKQPHIVRSWPAAYWVMVVVKVVMARARAMVVVIMAVARVVVIMAVAAVAVCATVKKGMVFALVMVRAVHNGAAKQRVRERKAKAKARMVVSLIRASWAKA